MINIIDLKLIQEKIKNYYDGYMGTTLGPHTDGHSDEWRQGFVHAFETVEELIEEFLQEAEKETLALIDKLIPDGYWMLNSFAKNQPDKFYIDNRVEIEDEDKIYKAVKRLADIRRQL